MKRCKLGRLHIRRVNGQEQLRELSLRQALRYAFYMAQGAKGPCYVLMRRGRRSSEVMEIGRSRREIRERLSMGRGWGLRPLHQSARSRRKRSARRGLRQ